jgi:Flp pilus assembly protein TadB
MRETNRGSKPDRFGLVAALLGALVFLAVITVTLPPLTRWLDTLIVMTTLFAPVVVAGILYTRIDRRGGWSSRHRLK